MDYKAPHISAFDSTPSRTGIQNPQATVQSPAAKLPQQATPLGCLSQQGLPLASWATPAPSGLA